jgi:hypothetical protein
MEGKPINFAFIRFFIVSCDFLACEIVDYASSIHRQKTNADRAGQLMEGAIDEPIAII